MLTVGVTTGSHELIAIHRPTGNKLGTVKFDVLANWTDEKLGPSFTVVGSVRSGPSGGTWGGADSGDFHVPQNVAVNKAVGERKIGVVLVDTASARYPTGAALQTIINNLRDEIVNGVGGQNRSVLRYYHEASNGLLTLDLVGIVGPISLLGDWTSYFALDPGGSGQWIANTGWPATVIAEIVAQNTAAVAAGGAPILDLSHMDSIIHVVRSVVAVPPAMDQFVWARAATAPETQLIGTTQLPGGLSMPTPRGIAWVNMPDDWAVARGGGRQFHETLAHELGHNLGS